MRGRVAEEAVSRETVEGRETFFLLWFPDSRVGGQAQHCFPPCTPLRIQVPGPKGPSAPAHTTVAPTLQPAAPLVNPTPSVLSLLPSKLGSALLEMVLHLLYVSSSMSLADQ